jgi:co-chaperonin GroES (HSP10)
MRLTMGRKVREVLGPTILLKVDNLKSANTTFKNSSILMPESMTEMETSSQTTGEVVQLGKRAFDRKDGFCNGTCPIKVGDHVFFSRYGAQRISLQSKEKLDYELWLVMDKDILAVVDIEEDQIDVV